MLAMIERVLREPAVATTLAGPLAAVLYDALLQAPPTMAAAAAGRNVGTNGSEEAVDSAAVGFQLCLICNCTLSCPCALAIALASDVAAH
jgi:hypothetical protein